MTQYDIPILSLFRFVANAQGFMWDNFLVLTINRRGVIGIYLLQAKMTAMAYTGLNNPDLIGLKILLTKI